MTSVLRGYNKLQQCLGVHKYDGSAFSFWAKLRAITTGEPGFTVVFEHDYPLVSLYESGSKESFFLKGK